MHQKARREASLEWPRNRPPGLRAAGCVTALAAPRDQGQGALPKPDP